MSHDVPKKIAQTLKCAKLLTRISGQLNSRIRGESADTGFRVATRYLAAELEWSYEIRRRRIKWRRKEVN